MYDNNRALYVTDEASNTENSTVDSLIHEIEFKKQ